LPASAVPSASTCVFSFPFLEKEMGIPHLSGPSRKPLAIL
jgi:hypothetical protein